MYKEIFTFTGWLRAVIFLLLVGFSRVAVKLTELVVRIVSSPGLRRSQGQT